MKVCEAVTLAEQLNPDQYGMCEKVQWLSALDGQVYADIMAGREDAPESAPAPYTQEDAQKELLIPAPYADEIYPAYLMMRGAFYNNESIRYANAQTMFNNALASFQRYWIRTHRALCRKRFCI